MTDQERKALMDRKWILKKQLSVLTKDIDNVKDVKAILSEIDYIDGQLSLL